MRKRIFVAAIAAVVVALPAWLVAQDSKPSAPVIESGHWRLHKFMQQVGEESYTIAKDGADLVITSKFRFTDRGSPVILNTTLRAAEDLTPRSFKTKGKVSRMSRIDDEITIDGTQATIRDGSVSRTMEIGKVFYTTTGYAPVVVQQEMARYAATHTTNGVVPTIPGGDVRIEPRGRDTVASGDRKVDLDRFVVTGLIWGREMFWLDAQRRLVALVSIDAEFDHFEAVEDGFLPALPTFVSRGAEDAMAALAALPATKVAMPDGPIAITGGRLIDGTGAPPVSPATVVIEKGRITATGPAAKVQIPAGARTIDATGKSVLPGLWDMHAHYAQVEWGPVYLAAGVTTVRDCGNEFDFITTVRDVIDRREGVGPRLLIAGLVDGNGPMALGVVRAGNEDEARAVVAKYKAARCHQIKIYSSVKKDVVAAICKAAHEAGMTVTGHIPNGMKTLEGVEAGMDMINHVTYLTEVVPAAKKGSTETAAEAPSPLLAALAKHHTIVDPTLVVYEWMLHPPSTPFREYEPGVERVARELYANLTSTGEGAPPTVFERMLAAVRVLHANGITIVAGTDGVVPGHSLHRELELYVKAGLTPMEAIQSATLVPARAMGLDKESGTVEAGKIADVIIVDGDPLASITDTRKVRTTIAAGRVFECGPLWESVGFKP